MGSSQGEAWHGAVRTQVHLRPCRGQLLLRPCVSEPEVGRMVSGAASGPRFSLFGCGCRYPRGSAFAHLHEDIEIAVPVEDARYRRVRTRAGGASGVGFPQLGVDRETPPAGTCEPAHEAVECRAYCRGDSEVVLAVSLAVICLAVRKIQKGRSFRMGCMAVPEAAGAKLRWAIGSQYAQQAVLAPKRYARQNGPCLV